MSKIAERNKLGQFVKGYIPWHKGLKGVMHDQGGEKNPMWGKKHSEKTLKKMRESHKGHLVSEDTKEKIGLANSGEKSYRWIKDRSTLEKNKRNDPEYKQWVKKIKERDNNICKLKNKDCYGYKVAHHIKGWAEYPELRYKVNNGITLCQAHHPKKRAEEKRLIPILEGLVSVSSE